MADPRLVPPARGGPEPSCYASPTHFCVRLVSTRGRLRYTVDSGRGPVPGAELLVTRGRPHAFQAIGVAASQPLHLTYSSVGPGERLVDGVTGVYPATDDSVFVLTPTSGTGEVLYYQSATHAGLGGAIRVLQSTAPEPATLPGGDPAVASTPRALLTHDARRAAVYFWDRPSNSSAAGSLLPPSSLDLASLATDTLYNHTRAQYEAALAVTCRHMPSRAVTCRHVPSQVRGRPRRRDATRPGRAQRHQRVQRHQRLGKRDQLHAAVGGVSRDAAHDGRGAASARHHVPSRTVTYRHVPLRTVTYRHR